jgi:hydroxymethylpyrimidine pyrophosphatase-like HAD family hydrolase
MDAVRRACSLEGTAVLFLSAGGQNKDIVGSFRHVVAAEPRRVILLTANPRSPLVQFAQGFRHVDVIVFDLPASRDGFLATNSLLASALLLYRAYANASLGGDDLPPILSELVYPGRSDEDYSAHLRDCCDPIWPRDTTLVLHGPSTSVVALDLESRFAEAALGTIQTADFRNFAHGRHNWLAKRGPTTGVLAFVAEADRSIADRTLELIPGGIPRARVAVPHDGSKSGLAGLVSSMHIAGLAGTARGIDPGRPGVPPFGGKIYNLQGFKSPKLDHAQWASAEVAVRRKIGRIGRTPADPNELAQWFQAYEAFVRRLQTSIIRAVVLDYDGTLCDGRDRYRGIDNVVAETLLRLLRSRAVIGVATGRGKSVRDVLRCHIPANLWPQVLIGYYNGAEVGSLGDDSCPNGTGAPRRELESVSKALQDNHVLGRHVTCTLRRHQLTLEPAGFVSTSAVYEMARHIAATMGGERITVVRSTHSVDILGPRVSKQSLVDEIRGNVGCVDGDEVLCIGDRGCWPGNDFRLLANPLSLSVDETSPDPQTCWYLAPLGHRGVQATLDYLCALEITTEVMRFQIPAASPRRR